MFQYFRGNYAWNLAICAALNNGSEIDEVCRPLLDKAGDGVAASGEWSRAWAKLGERLSRLGEMDEQAGHRRSAGRMTLEGVMQNVTCSILITHGEADKQIPLEYAVKTYDAAINSGRRELKIFTADEQRWH